jgi:tRNA dimethylallyltransferase
MHFSPMPLTDCWYLSGPTASGKTAVGIELARRLNAEIISLDSMAVYRGMDIGTAKPSLAERRDAPHHLLDVVDPDEEYCLARYVADAERASEAIRARGKTPLFVGGTPLYLKSLLRGIFSGPPADWAFRRRLLAIAASEGSISLHARLTEVDPASALRLHPSDTRRVIRALEVWEKTGQSITSLQQQFAHARAAKECRVFVLDWPREELVARIDSRVEAMFSQGLVGEVRGLLDRYPTLSHTATQAVGYREVLEHLSGLHNLIETIDLVKLRTRQFAKRQRTWFRGLSECRFVLRAADDEVLQIVDEIARLGAEIV